MLWGAPLTPLLHTQFICCGARSLRTVLAAAAYLSTADEREALLPLQSEAALEDAIRRACAVRVRLFISGALGRSGGEHGLPSMSTTLVAAERARVREMVMGHGPRTVFRTCFSVRFGRLCRSSDTWRFPRASSTVGITAAATAAPNGRRSRTRVQRPPPRMSDGCGGCLRWISCFPTDRRISGAVFSSSSGGNPTKMWATTGGTCERFFSAPSSPL